MQLPNSKIELATSQESSRYTLAAVKYDVEAKKFVATDGHILACIPASTGGNPDDHSALIGLDAMKQLRAIAKQDKNVPPDIHTNGNISVQHLGMKTELPVVEGQFPNYEAVKPKFEGKATISFDAALLMRLAQALDGEASNKKAIVQLWINGESNAIGVKVSNCPEAWGALMPVRM